MPYLQQSCAAATDAPEETTEPLNGKWRFLRGCLMALSLACLFYAERASHVVSAWLSRRIAA